MTNDPKSRDFEKPAEAANKSRNLQEAISPLTLALRQILVWHPGSDGPRIHRDYRGLFACLTPRQIKFFLRERLLTATAREGADEDGPAGTFLRTLFHPFWKVGRDEPGLFDVLAHAAATVLNQSGELREKGKLNGPAAELFRLQLEALAPQSVILSADAVQFLWPSKTEERALLLHLLTAVYFERGGVWAVARRSVRISSFVKWVQQYFGRRPEGVGPAEQLSSFQQMALERHRSGDRSALAAVVEYADRFLVEHTKSLDASSAIALSNLAVLINDVSGAEAQCDRLFQAAVNLAQAGTRIPFYYAEFLLDTLEDSGRRGRLMPQPYGDETAIVGQAQAVLTRVADRDIEEADRFYRDLLRYRLSTRPEADRSKRMDGLWALTRTYDRVLVTGGREPSSRLNDGLDAVIGKRGTAFQMKEPLQGIVWSAQKRAGTAAWAMAIQIANDFIGESTAGSDSEKLGLRMNAALVCDETLMTAGENDRLAAIWSQSGAFLAQRIGKTANARVAQAFLASLAYGGEPQWMERSRQSWELIGGDTNVPASPEAWLTVLNAEARQRVRNLSEDPANADIARALAQAAFAPEYWPPLDDPAELAREMGWSTLTWAEGMSFELAVNALAVDTGLAAERAE